MKFKLKASKKTLKEIIRKGNKALSMGDKKSFQRAKAIELISTGHTFLFISNFLGVSYETIRLWVRDFLFMGIKFLNYKNPPGRPGKLTKSQKKELAKDIDEGPEKLGFMGGCWRSPMIQMIIEKKFGITYSCFYISTLLKNMGFSYQKATFVSAQRDEAIRSVWLEKIWPAILKEAKEKDSHVFFGDECSFSQFGTLSYTWARRGIQPEIKTSGSKKSLKVFGLIDYFSGKFLSMAIDGKFNSDSYQIFLEDVLRKTNKHIILIQDGARYHTSDDMEDFFCKNNKRVSVYQLPACSPDFNPIEMLWKKIKEKGTHLKYFPSFDSLTEKVEELLIEFSNSKEEVLSLFGLYEKIEFAEVFKAAG